jgi:bacteriocin-like protein
LFSISKEGKKMILSNQPENEVQHAKTITTENPLAEINASKQEIAELSDKQLEQITGGIKWKRLLGRIGLDVVTYGGYEAGRPLLKKDIGPVP